MRLAAILILLVASSPASAQRITGELRAGGGYDSNAAFAPDPGNRRRPEGRAVTMGQGVFVVNGAIEGALLDPAGALAARFDLDGHVFGSGDLAFSERLAISSMLRVDDLRVRCAVRGARFDATLTADDAWTAGARCGVLGHLPEGFWIEGGLDVGVRAFDAAQLDGWFGGGVAAGWIHDLVAVELGFDALRRESDDRDAVRVELAPWATVRVSTPYVGGTISYALVARLFDRDVRSGQEHVGRVEVWGMPLAWLGAYAQLELGLAEGRTQALAYERVAITGGVRLVLDWQAEPGGHRAVIDDGRVRLSFELPDAERVSIVASWNDWEEMPLIRRGDRFEGEYTLPPGRHEYHLIVDGQAQRPPGAVRYTSDDFGGENAVIEVE